MKKLIIISIACLCIVGCKSKEAKLKECAEGVIAGKEITKECTELLLSSTPVPTPEEKEKMEKSAKRQADSIVENIKESIKK
jgi:uncharacterized protein YcfL